MDNERLDALFAEAVKIPATGRARWLDANCGGDVALRQKLEQLLAADARAEDVLEHGPDLLAAALADTVEMPQRFGVWHVLESLGAGGMGEVWLAERDDGEFRQRAAIKQVAWPTPGLLQRFRNERQILARLEHPGISRLIDGGVDGDGCPWLAMEYVEGVPVTDWAREPARDVRAIVLLVLRICDAVQFAHRNLVVHSDIKPSNILVANDKPKLLDFGIAKVLAQDDAARTRTIARLMTPDYAAPELLAGGTVTTAVDVYALGVLLYELLSGSKPYRLATHGQDPQRALSDLPIKPPSNAVDKMQPDAHARRRALRGDLDGIVLTAMALEPARRYDSVEALASDLRGWLDGRAIAARGHGRWYRFGKFVRRNRVAVSATVLTFAALLGATLYSTHQAHLARAQATRANAVRDFVVGVFAQTDPDARQGKPITAHELLNNGEQQLAQGSIASSASRTEMQGLIGHLYWLIGDYPKGVSLMQGAVKHPDAATPAEVRATNLLYLAQSELDKNFFATARSHALEARTLAMQAGDAGEVTASEARRVYANSLLDVGDARTAEPLLRQALKEDSAQYGERSEAVAGDLGLLASATQTLGRHDESIAFSNRAIAIYTALHGRDSGAVMAELLTRAATNVYAGDAPAAERDQRAAVAVATKLYGPTHVTTLSMRANLYMIYALDEHYEQALAGHLDVLSLTQPFARDRQEQLAYEWDGIAVDYLGLGRYDEALHAARQSMAAFASSRTPDFEVASNDPRTVSAEILTAMGRLDEAEATFKEAIRIEGQNAQPDSSSLNRDLAYLGNVYRLQHRYPEALAMTTKAMHALSPRTGSSRRRAVIELMLAQAQLDAGDVAAAQRTAAQADQTAAIAYKSQPLAFSAFQYLDARIALAQGDPVAAERLLRTVFATRKALPANDYRLVETQVNLIRALEMQGKDGEAKPLRAQVEPVLAASKSPYFADLHRQLDRR